MASKRHTIGNPLESGQTGIGADSRLMGMPWCKPLLESLLRKEVSSASTFVMTHHFITILEELEEETGVESRARLMMSPHQKFTVA